MSNIGTGEVVLLLFILIFWIAPIIVGHKIGKRKGRVGWLWGLLLGWIGVLAIAVLGARGSRAE